jgi:hypothetical protein
MQPTYLPWAGYFALIELADVFMFYDTAQFSKSSWHYRNRILCQNEVKWISLNIQHKHEQCLNETKILVLNKQIKKHSNTIKTYYAKAPYFNDAYEIILYLNKRVFECQTEPTLAALNIQIITFICEKLMLKTKLIRSSSIPVNTDNIIISEQRSGKLSHYLKAMKCTKYFSPIGAKEYIQTDNVIERLFHTTYCDFTPQKYKQFSHNESFAGYLSIIDVVANLGWEKASQYIKDMSCQIKHIN